ncbi:mycothiol synthase [Cellulomonas cellasea]|uniref:Mycothiol acetyltransferase n=1 Tax=Cellulomonas cellasea TaxID=43670 RepID=A0A7W4YA45_9CELL|nr:mycothiol synthase [Cellulomonas cellasea]MBB2922360.1 mycothiol synthase [Cellulomonas cellasea]
MSRMVALDVVTGPLLEPVAADVRRVADAAHAADGVAPLSEQPLLWLTDPAAAVRHVLARDDVGALVGYAQVDLAATPVPTAELVVAPDARRAGTGTALLGAAGSVAAGDAHGSVAVWAHGDLPAARALAARHGLAPVRELWQMRLDLASAAPADPGSDASAPVTPAPAAPPPAPRPLPDGVRVRAFVPGQDEDAWLGVNARAFASHPEQGRMTLADLRAREAEPWFDPDGLLLAERDGTLLASLWTKVHAPDATSPEPVGEIYALGVDPDAQGLGLGGALTGLALEHLAARGLRTVILYTERENTAAVRTYTRAGFVRSAVDVLLGPPARTEPPGDRTALIVPTTLPDTPGSPASGTMER